MLTFLLRSKSWLEILNHEFNLGTKLDIRNCKMNFENRMSREEQDRRIDVTLKAPFQRFVNLKISEREPGYSTLEMESSENVMNATGFVHGGVIYAMLDVAAYVALLPLMNDDQNAVTHDIFVNVIRPSPKDRTIIFKGIVRKVGKRLAFCDSEAYCDGELVATGRITKSIIG